MKTKKAFTASLISLAVTGSLMLSSAMAQEVFNRTITLGPGMTGEFVIEDLGIGDTVNMTLINPTSQALTFRTTQQIGEESSWVVPANSQRMVSFDYNVPFSDDVNFVVMNTMGQTLAQGVLVNIDDDAVFRRTVTLEPGMGELVMEELGIGDTVVLTLNNPTDVPLTFRTTERLGDENQWIVPANSSRNIAFEYTQPFSDDVEYRVQQPTGVVIAEGVLIPLPQEQRATVRGYW